MAFNVAYYDLLGKNIRHIYSSLPSDVRFRCDPEPGVNLHAHDGCLTPSNKRRLAPKAMHPGLYRRLWTYSREFGCPVRRAPALRTVTPDKAQRIVNRVHSATPSRRRRRHHGRDDVNADDVTTPSHVSSSRPSTSLSSCTEGTEGTQGGRGLSSARSRAQEVEVLTERLMRPTIAWSIRSDLREGSVLDPVKVVAHRVEVRRRRCAETRSAHL